MTQTQTEAAQQKGPQPVVVRIRSMHGRQATTKICLDHKDPLVADLRPDEVVQLPGSVASQFAGHACLELTNEAPTRPFRFKTLIEVMEHDPRFKKDPRGAIALQQAAVDKLSKRHVDDAQKELKAEMRGQLKGEMLAELRAELRAELSSDVRQELLAELKAELREELKNQKPRGRGK